MQLQTLLQSALVAFDVMLEHELTIRNFALHNAIRIAKGSEVCRPTTPRLAVTFKERCVLARNCERGDVLGATLISVVRRLIEIFHVGVVTMDCFAQGADGVDAQPTQFQILRQMRFARLVSPVGPLH